MMKSQFKKYLEFYLQLGILFFLTSLSIHASTKPAAKPKGYAPKTVVHDTPRLWKPFLDLGSLPTCILDQGGQGDCFFFSIAAALGSRDPRTTAKSLRKLLSEEITEANWKENLYQISDGFMVSGQNKSGKSSGIGTQIIHWESIFEDQLNYPGEPWKLLRDLIDTMASKQTITIIRGTEELDLKINYWGNLWAVRKLSLHPSFRTIRFILLNSRELAIGEKIPAGNGSFTSTASVFSDEERATVEAPKTHNVLLWWTGGHYQILGKQVLVDRSIDGILHLNDTFYAVLWPNEHLPQAIRDLYVTLCSHRI